MSIQNELRKFLWKVGYDISRFTPASHPLVPMYDGESLFIEMCSLMDKKGYTLVAIENGFSDPASGQLLQFDGIFHRL